MLLRYIVSNFKSIGHPLEFNMFTAEDNTDNRFLKTIATKAGEWKILKRGVFFGSNASGKSSFIESIAFAKNYIVNPQQSGNGTGINQFKDSFQELKGISLFQFMFYLDNEIYEYGFSLDRYKVCEEWLLVLTKKEFAPLFTRCTDVNGNTKISVESKLARRNSKDRQLADALTNSMQAQQQNQLFLHELSKNGVKKAEKIMQWFENLQIIFPENEKSVGVKRLSVLLSRLLANGAKPTIFFADELDQGLYTELSQFLVDRFIRCAEISCNQLIFTCHDLNLMDLDHFRQDEIWFITKNQLRESKLRPLSDFEIQGGQNILKAYLCGRYVAIPAA